MIRGVLDEGRPTLTAVVQIPQFNLTGDVRFLVDTGADGSLIHPKDAQRLGISYRRHFAGGLRSETRGIGGVSFEYIEPCLLLLTHSDGIVDRIELELNFAMPRRINATYPSLLGRDVLRHYRLVFQESIGLVALE